MPLPHLSHPRLHRLSTDFSLLGGGHRHGGPKENHDGIADELIDGAVVLKDGLIHHGEVIASLPLG